MVLLLLAPGVMADEAKATQASPNQASTSQPSATPRANQGSANSLDDKVQSLKKEVMNLNRDLLVLEEELLFPTSTQVAVFLSIDVGNYFRLDSVQLKIDDKIVANHLYTQQEVDALGRGGVQRLYLGNVKKVRANWWQCFAVRVPMAANTSVPRRIPLRRAQARSTSS